MLTLISLFLKLFFSSQLSATNFNCQGSFFVLIPFKLSTYCCASNLLLPCWLLLKISMEVPSSFFVDSVLDLRGMHFARTMSPSCSMICNREPLQGAEDHIQNPNFRLDHIIHTAIYVNVIII